MALNWAYSKKHRVTEGNGIEADQLLSFLGGRGSIPGKGPGRGNRKKKDQMKAKSLLRNLPLCLESITRGHSRDIAVMSWWLSENSVRYNVGRNWEGRENTLQGVSLEPRQSEKLKPLVMSLRVFNVGSCGGHWSNSWSLIRLSSSAGEVTWRESLHRGVL